MTLSAEDVIKFARQQKGLTQNELGELLGVGKSTIQKYEGGSVTNLKLDTIRKLCHSLDLLPFMLIYPTEITAVSSGSDLYRYNMILSAFLKLNPTGQGSRIYDGFVAD